MPGKKEFALPCGGCGESVVVSATRYRQLIESNSLPLCRTNGCYRYLTTRRRAADKEIPVRDYSSINLKLRAKKKLKQGKAVYRPTKIMEGEADIKEPQ